MFFHLQTFFFGTTLLHPNHKICLAKFSLVFFCRSLGSLGVSRHTIEEQDEEPLMEVEVPVWWPRIAWEFVDPTGEGVRQLRQTNGDFKVSKHKSSPCRNHPPSP